ncbi:MAG TPA: hypothetical protein VEK79_01600 [Thermoanaerobaculia bacterium]|nr:hypothetical protein [Thermoanaerobaculia bacterium]
MYRSTEIDTERLHVVPAERKTVQREATFYQLGNQPSFKLDMGPARLLFRGGDVRMTVGIKTENNIPTATNPRPGVTCTPYNSLSARSGWSTHVSSASASTGNIIFAAEQLWMKGRLTRRAVRTYVEPTLDSCSKHTARYVYRYHYIGPDGTETPFFERPGEVARMSTWTEGSCSTRTPLPAIEPDHYWSTDGNAALDVSDKCRPLVRWADGSTEEFHAPDSGDPFSPSLNVAPPFRASCTAEDLTRDLRVTDRNGNVTTYRFTSTTQTTTDPQGRATVLTFDRDEFGFQRLRSVDLPSIGAAAPLRYTVNWRATPMEVNFAAIWPDITCRRRSDGAAESCGTSRVQLVDSITVPDGRQYRFQYGPWGNLTHAFQPGGAVQHFEYGDPTTNMAYAEAVAPLVNHLESSSLCGDMWTDDVHKMQARGRTIERIHPDGLANAGHPSLFSFSRRTLDPARFPTCSYDRLGAADGGPLACAQVWSEVTQPNLAVIKRGTIVRAVPRAFDPDDQRISAPPSFDPFPHGWTVGEETWSGSALVAAMYNVDPASAEAYYDFDVVKAVASPFAITSNVRSTKTIAIRDGLATTTNFVHGSTVDIDPGSGTESRNTEAATETCLFGGHVTAMGCTGGTKPLMRTGTAYTRFRDLPRRKHSEPRHCYASVRSR